MTASGRQAGYANLRVQAQNRKLDRGEADRVPEVHGEALDAAQDGTGAVPEESIAEESVAGGLRGVAAAQAEEAAVANRTKRFNSRRTTRLTWRNATGVTSASSPAW